MTPEKTLWRGRPSFWNFWPSMAIGDLFIMLAAALWCWTDYSRWAPLTLAVAAPFYLAVVFKRNSVSYTVSDQRVSVTRGLLSRTVDELELADIRNIVLSQTIFERLVGIGTVAISTAATHEVEVFLRGIPGAEHVKEIIRGARLDNGQGPGD